jgi:hypothetical protein
MSAFLAPPPRPCSVPRCNCNGRHTARVLPLCRCLSAPHLPCPAHPTREDFDSRARLLVVGLLCIAIAVAVALWFVGSELR